MTATPGQAAHARWQEAASVRGISTDDWDELEQWDREAWEAAQEPHAAPGERAALEDIARAGQGSIDTSIPLDRDWLVTRALEGLGWLPEGWPKEPQPAPELDEQVRLARQDRDQLRKHVLDLAAEYEAEAFRIAPPGAPEDPPDMADYIRAETLNVAAARLRQVAEPPS